MPLILVGHVENCACEKATWSYGQFKSFLGQLARFYFYVSTCDAFSVWVGLNSWHALLCSGSARNVCSEITCSGGL